MDRANINKILYLFIWKYLIFNKNHKYILLAFAIKIPNQSISG